MAIVEERLRIKKASEEERLRIKKNVHDRKIMFMDTSNLDETEKAYVEAMRSEILASTMGFSLGGDFNFGGGDSGSGIV